MQCQIWQAEVEDDLESKPARDILQEHASTFLFRETFGSYKLHDLQGT